MTQPHSSMPQMPEYGVDRATWSPLPWSWASARLVPARNYWLVTVSASGRPHALPVWGVWDDDEQRFVFSCAPHSRKARNLSGNDRVVIAAEDTVECVSVEGSAHVITDSERQQVWVQRYLAKYRPLAPELSAGFIGENLLVEVRPDRAFAVIEREDEFATRATRWTF